MSEMPSFEQQEVTREQVIEAYKKFVERGITSPDDLDMDDPEVIEANDLYQKWRSQQDPNDERVNFEMTKFYVDAGFTDSNYLEDVLSWLRQDAHNAEKDLDDPARTQLRQDIAEEIKKIRSLLKNQKANL